MWSAVGSKSQSCQVGVSATGTGRHAWTSSDTVLTVSAERLMTALMWLLESVSVSLAATLLPAYRLLLTVRGR